MTEFYFFGKLVETHDYYFKDKEISQNSEFSTCSRKRISTSHS